MIRHSRPTIESDDIKAVEKVMKSGFIGQGNKVEEFEKEMARTIGVKHAVAVNSGTSALHLVLLSLGIREKDEVIIPSLTCTALLNAINYVKAESVVVDVDQRTLNISVENIKKNITEKTKAVVVPYMFGNPAPIDEIMEFCKKHGVRVIEDCAQNLGGQYTGRMLGSYGDASIASFYATKVITTGEGGMVLTNDENIWRNVADLKDYDKRETYRVRYNYKMTEMQAALGVTQLRKLPVLLSRRKEIAEEYNKHFESWMPSDSIYYRYLIKSDDPDDVIEKLERRHIESAKCVIKPLKNLRVSSYVHKHAVSVPIYPSLQHSELKEVVKALREICRCQK